MEGAVGRQNRKPVSHSLEANDVAMGKSGAGLNSGSLLTRKYASA